jgi:steroid delta-isomerase-like uncharacterized protein
MSTQDNIKLSRQMFDAWNAHDADRWVKLLDEHFVVESDTMPAPIRGREAARGFMAAYLKAFPDIHFEIPQVLAEGDFVVSRWSATGTHRGELMGVAPTNRRTRTNGCSVLQIKQGKAVHNWVYWDTGHLLRELGVLK